MVTRAQAIRRLREENDAMNSEGEPTAPPTSSSEPVEPYHVRNHIMLDDRPASTNTEPTTSPERSLHAKYEPDWAPKQKTSEHSWHARYKPDWAPKQTKSQDQTPETVLDAVLQDGGAAKFKGAKKSWTATTQPKAKPKSSALAVQKEYIPNFSELVASASRHSDMDVDRTVTNKEAEEYAYTPAYYNPETGMAATAIQLGFVDGPLDVLSLGKGGMNTKYMSEKGKIAYYAGRGATEALLGYGLGGLAGDALGAATKSEKVLKAAEWLAKHEKVGAAVKGALKGAFVGGEAAKGIEIKENGGDWTDVIGSLGGDFAGMYGFEKGMTEAYGSAVKDKLRKNFAKKHSRFFAGEIHKKVPVVIGDAKQERLTLTLLDKDEFPLTFKPKRPTVPRGIPKYDILKVPEEVPTKDTEITGTINTKPKPKTTFKLIKPKNDDVLDLDKLVKKAKLQEKLDLLDETKFLDDEKNLPERLHTDKNVIENLKEPINGNEAKIKMKVLKTRVETLMDENKDLEPIEESESSKNKLIMKLKQEEDTPKLKRVNFDKTKLDELKRSTDTKAKFASMMKRAEKDIKRATDLFSSEVLAAGSLETTTKMLNAVEGIKKGKTRTTRKNRVQREVIHKYEPEWAPETETETKPEASDLASITVPLLKLEQEPELLTTEAPNIESKGLESGELKRIIPTIPLYEPESEPKAKKALKKAQKTRQKRPSTPIPNPKAIEKHFSPTSKTTVKTKQKHEAGPGTVLVSGGGVIHEKPQLLIDYSMTGPGWEPGETIQVAYTPGQWMQIFDNEIEKHMSSELDVTSSATKKVLKSSVDVKKDSSALPVPVIPTEQTEQTLKKARRLIQKQKQRQAQISGHQTPKQTHTTTPKAATATLTATDIIPPAALAALGAFAPGPEPDIAPPPAFSPPAGAPSGVEPVPTTTAGWEAPVEWGDLSLGLGFLDWLEGDSGTSSNSKKSKKKNKKSNKGKAKGKSKGGSKKGKHKQKKSKKKKEGGLWASLAL